MQKRVSRHKPARWVECVVYYSVPQISREEYVIDLRRRYRARLKSRGAEAARALARREGLAWLRKDWPWKIWLAVSLVARMFNRFTSV
jgi:hypothetical protein